MKCNDFGEKLKMGLGKNRKIKEMPTKFIQGSKISTRKEATENCGWKGKQRKK